MSTPELAQLEMLAQVDDLLQRLRRWSQGDSAWEPMSRCRALVRRLLERAESLRVRLESPLVVATFGGTGTGKSTLVNALVGRECSPTGRQRPTTTRPVLIVHPELEPETLGLPLEGFDIVRADSPLLRDIVILDCPDPDTSEAETPGSNLERLHRLLPYCDVLIYTTTQQKYRSARVAEELAEAASGCRLLYVQTHADLDDDIRDDWVQQLDHRHYAVPDVFWVDSLGALKQQQAGRQPGGDFRRLQQVLTTELAAANRVQIRRANLIDLLHAALQHCRQELAGHWPAIEQLQGALEQEQQKLTAAMARQLRDELLLSRSLWERRLLTSVTTRWGLTPFTAVLRLYSGLGSLAAGMTFFRARNAAQMALIGALEGTRWLKARREEQLAEDRLQRLSSLALDDNLLRQAHFVLAGHVQAARLDPAQADPGSVDRLRHQAARVEDQFLGDASRHIDRLIAGLAQQNSGFFTWAWYELLLLAYLGFVLFRMGKNFFYDTFFKQLWYGPDVATEPLLSVDFYLPAGLFLLLWAAVLVMAFTRRLRRGLRGRIEELAAHLARQQLAEGLFPELQQTCRQLQVQRDRLQILADTVTQLRTHLATAPGLGRQLAPTSPASGLLPQC